MLEEAPNVKETARMKKFQACLAATLWLCLAAVGAGSTAAMLAAPALAQQPAPSAAQIEAARLVVVSSGMVRSFDSLLPQFSEQIRQTLITRPELTKDLSEVLDKLKPELEQQKKEMIDAAARIFAGRLSEQELKEIGAFFSSATGRRYVETQPVILDEMFNEMQNWTQRVSQFVIERVRTEMKKRGHEL
jgi:hypothetical protein